MAKLHSKITSNHVSLKTTPKTEAQSISHKTCSHDICNQIQKSYPLGHNDMFAQSQYILCRASSICCHHSVLLWWIPLARLEGWIQGCPNGQQTNNNRNEFDRNLVFSNPAQVEPDHSASWDISNQSGLGHSCSGMDVHVVGCTPNILEKTVVDEYINH